MIDPITTGNIVYRVPILEALDWDLPRISLRQAITDTADSGFNRDGSYRIVVDGTDFVAVYIRPDWLDDEIHDGSLPEYGDDDPEPPISGLVED